MARRFRTARDTATGRLMSAYREGGDERARTRLVELYMPLVEALAHRHDRHGAEHDDLVQAGLDRAAERDRAVRLRSAARSSWRSRCPPSPAR